MSMMASGVIFVTIDVARALAIMSAVTALGFFCRNSSRATHQMRCG
jgi:hypothetical protein